MTTAVRSSSASDAYRRQARRLRCHFAGQPARLQHSLRALADATPPVSPAPSVIVSSPERPPAYPAPAQTGPARAFVDHVNDRLGESSVLRYTLRLELLRAARGFGIGRFEANLLIAAVLERRRRQGVSSIESPHERSLVSGLTVFCLVQGAIALGTWWMFMRG